MMMYNIKRLNNNLHLSFTNYIVLRIVCIGHAYYTIFTFTDLYLISPDVPTQNIFNKIFLQIQLLYKLKRNEKYI